MGTPHSPKLQHYWSLSIRLFSVISRTLVAGWVYPFAEKKQSMYSTTQADWATRNSSWGLLPLYKEADGVFFSPSRLDNKKLVVRDLTPLQKSSQCILQPKPTGQQETRRGGSYPSTKKQMVYSSAQADSTTRNSSWGILPLYRKAVSVFYSPSRLGNKKLVVGAPTPLQRSRWCILQSKPTG